MAVESVDRVSERCCMRVQSAGPVQLLCREQMVGLSPASAQPSHFTDDWLMASTNEQGMAREWESMGEEMASWCSASPAAEESHCSVSL